MVQIQKGSITVLRVFDIAEEIRLETAEELLRNSGQGRHQFTALPKSVGRALVVRAAPLVFSLEQCQLQFLGKSWPVDIHGKLRDFGVLSLDFQIQIPAGTNWDDLVSLAAAIEDSGQLDEVAVARSKSVTDILRPALKMPQEWAEYEDYTIFFVQELQGIDKVSRLHEIVDVPSLILAEKNAKISEKTRNSIIENTFQYSEQDMTVIDWNAALVVEPDGKREIPDILEYALIHLMEMRYYDSLLDRRLALLYDRIEHNMGRFLKGTFSELYQESSTRYIEFSEFTERVENSLKFVGDSYLATVFRAANRRFRLSDWQESITRKMNILAQVSSLLQGEVNIRRSHWLEIIIIFLIGFEIVAAIFKMF